MMMRLKTAQPLGSALRELTCQPATRGGAVCAEQGTPPSQWLTHAGLPLTQTRSSMAALRCSSTEACTHHAQPLLGMT